MSYPAMTLRKCKVNVKERSKVFTRMELAMSNVNSEKIAVKGLF